MLSLEFYLEFKLKSNPSALFSFRKRSGLNLEQSGKYSSSLALTNVDVLVIFIMNIKFYNSSIYNNLT